MANLCWRWTCEAVRAIIDSLSTEELNKPFLGRTANHPNKDIYVTSLMDVHDLGLYCPDEVLLVIAKATNINKQDKNGNTALHHLFLDMIHRTYISDLKLDFIDALRARGASFDIPNKDNTTVNQLRLILKQKKDKCDGDTNCDRL